MNYENDIKIDESALDVEWLEQPRLMIKYAQILVQAKKEEEQAKDELEVIQAELDKEIRIDPEKFDIVKITETVVRNTILLDSSYKEVFEKYLESRYEAEMAKLALRSIEHRKDALENLVKLHGQQYFAGPSVPRDLSKEWEQKQTQKNTDEKVRIRRKK